MPKSKRKAIKNVKTNSVSWFDNNNARLILLCALFGFVGAHKFAQRKIFQGICFILLDLTLFGIIISMIWAFFDLLDLTINKTDKPGNIIFGSLFLMGSLLSVPFVFGGWVFGDYSNSKQQPAIDQNKVYLQEDVICSDNKGNAFEADIALYANHAIVTAGTKVFNLKITDADFAKLKVYRGYVGADLEYDSHITWSSNPEHTVALRVELNGQDLEISMTGKAMNGVFGEYDCSVK